MIQKIQSLKSKKGFTLVELIVVLIILAILAALLIPTLTGYIDNANKKKVIAETRMVAMAAQTVAGDLYAKTGNGLKQSDFTDDTAKEIRTLAEITDDTVHFSIKIDSMGAVKEVVYTDANYSCVLANGAYTSKKGGDTTITKDQLFLYVAP